MTDQEKAALLALRSEVSGIAVNALIAAIPQGATEAEIIEIHLGLIWNVAFVLMATAMDARTIRATVDDAIRDAIILNGQRQ